ncbi:MAG TPA: MBL fold metallo-hydrolase [Nitrospiria bacterium]|nr:MBL fold metallo-hydrolase [Nitrospiria bacterium]
MKITTLGCYGAELATNDAEGRAVTYHNSEFRVNRSVVIDAGTFPISPGIDEWTEIRQLLSHIHSLDEILAGLHDRFLNETVWPDFIKRPSRDRPVFRLSGLREEDRRRVGELQVIAVRVNHSVPTVGFILQDKNGAMLYGGDTHETTRIWEVAASTADLKAVLIETSFPDELHDLAILSGHLTPRLLAREFAKIGKPDIPLYVYHMKPQYLGPPTAEINALRIPNVRLLKDGDIFGV